MQHTRQVRNLTADLFFKMDIKKDLRSSFVNLVVNDPFKVTLKCKDCTMAMPDLLEHFWLIRST